MDSVKGRKSWVELCDDDDKLAEKALNPQTPGAMCEEDELMDSISIKTEPNVAKGHERNQEDPSEQGNMSLLENDEVFRKQFSQPKDIHLRCRSSLSEAKLSLKEDIKIKQEQEESDEYFGGESAWSELVQKPSDKISQSSNGVIFKVENSIDGTIPANTQSLLQGSKTIKEEPVSSEEVPEKCYHTSNMASSSNQLKKSMRDLHKSAPGPLTFAQICAKSSQSHISVENALSSPVVQQEDSHTDSASESLMDKKDRKRSLFPKAKSSEQSFGILDENAIDSPCKDIREIMTNIHMDSPLKLDENCSSSTVNGRRSSPRKAVLLKRRDLSEALKSPNKNDGCRKRTHEATKGQDSPVTKRAAIQSSSVRKHRNKKPLETDPEVLSRRQKQIDYGKNTVGYSYYIEMVPKDKREKRHPKTPPKQLQFSRRSWDGLVKVWRQKLHFWDPSSHPNGIPTELPESWDTMSDISTSASDGMSEPSLPSTPQSTRKKPHSSHANSESDCQDYHMDVKMEQT